MIFHTFFSKAYISLMEEPVILVLWRNVAWEIRIPGSWGWARIITWLFWSIFPIYLHTYLFIPPGDNRHWIFCIDRHAANVFPSTGDMFRLKWGLVGGICLLGWKKWMWLSKFRQNSTIIVGYMISHTNFNQLINSFWGAIIPQKNMTMSCIIRTD